MVTYLKFIIFLSALISPLHAAKISVELKKDTLYENSPIEGEVSIVHKKEEEINLKTARVDGKPIAIKFVREVNSPEGLKSTYNFLLEEKAGGLHILQPFSIEVGGTLLKSPQLTYEIKGARAESKAVSQSSDDVIFKLEPFIDGKKIFYPRQRATFGYRLFFNQSIELRDQTLPLLDPPGFKKIGSEEVNNSRNNNIGIREMKQKVEADKPGVYTIAPSKVEGMPYEMTLFQTKEYLDKPVQATSPGMSIEIKAFPEKGRPPSFNGAIGQDLQFRVVTESFTDVNVGDKVTFSLQISGDGEVENTPMPDLCCQPGFPGKFRQSDIPPAEIFKNGIKFFVIDMYPLSTSVKEIPSIEFSFFNPDSETYTALKSDPIPIKVRPTAEGLSELKEAPQKEPSTQTDWPELNAKPTKIDIETIFPLTPGDLESRFLGSLSALLILLLGPLAILVQMDYMQRVAKRKKGGVETAKPTDLWNDIDQLPDDSPDLSSKISKTLLLQLKEQGLIERSDISFRDLPNTGVASEIKDFLAKLEEERFSKFKKTDPKTMRLEGKKLFDKIGSASK